MTNPHQDKPPTHAAVRFAERKGIRLAGFECVVHEAFCAVTIGASTLALFLGEHAECVTNPSGQTPDRVVDDISYIHEVADECHGGSEIQAKLLACADGYWQLHEKVERLTGEVANLRKFVSRVEQGACAPGAFENPAMRLADMSRAAMELLARLPKGEGS